MWNCKNKNATNIYISISHVIHPSKRMFRISLQTNTHCFSLKCLRSLKFCLFKCSINMLFEHSNGDFDVLLCNTVLWYVESRICLVPRGLVIGSFVHFNFVVAYHLSCRRRATWRVHGQSLPRQAPGGRDSGHRQTGDSKQNLHTKASWFTEHTASRGFTGRTLTETECHSLQIIRCACRVI